MNWIPKKDFVDGWEVNGVTT